MQQSLLGQKIYNDDDAVWGAGMEKGEVKDNEVDERRNGDNYYETMHP